MKRNLLLFLFGIYIVGVSAQNSVPNGNFENWTSGTYSLPGNYPVSSNPSSFYRTKTAFNVTKATPGYHGSNGVQLTTTIGVIGTQTDTVFAYMVPVQPNGSPDSWHGGMAYDQMATGIRGYYKYNLATADSGTILIAFSKGGVNIGTYVYSLGGIKSAYTLFNFTFIPALSTTPDSVIFAAISCKFTPATQQPKATAAGSLVLDSISFTGVASQPALFNGDFETWTDHTVALPDNWYYSGNDQGDGLYRVLQSHYGNFALELVTYSEIGNGGNHIQAGQVSNGFYDNTCSCQHGGFPFTNQIDTLTFYYVYTPAGTDSAMINISFIKNGLNIWGNNTYLKASPNYQYMQIPYDIGQVPDSAIISIASSSYNPLPGNVGSQLIIDEIEFQSVITSLGIRKNQFTNQVGIYPNPASGTLNIHDRSFRLEKLEIYNLEGKMVYSKSGFKPQTTSMLDISGVSKGIYFVKMFNAGSIHTEKIVIQ